MSGAPHKPPPRSHGTLESVRVPQPWPEGRPFRILSIDGGGICGILPATILGELERRYLNGRPITEYFDMIAGTSTGGIIALGLANGRAAQDVAQLYVERGHVIFPINGLAGQIRGGVRRIFQSKFDNATLKSELQSILGDATLGDAHARLCIPSFEGAHGESWIYKTPHHPDYQRDRSELLVRVAMATSAAPTYLEALSNNGYLMLDGGLWANNPVANALVDALSCFTIERNQVRILSLGCGESAFQVDNSMKSGGLLQWRNAMTGVMRAQSLNALGQSYLLVGKPNVLRLDAPKGPHPIALDDHRRAAEELPAVARSIVDAGGEHIRSVFLGRPAERFVPCPPQTHRVRFETRSSSEAYSSLWVDTREQP